MLQIYIEKFGMRSCYLYRINKVFYKKKDAQRNMSRVSDHSELLLRKEKVTPPRAPENSRTP